MLTLQVAEAGELDLIMELIRQAKAHLKKMGVDQWQTGYPDAAHIREDLRGGNGYLLVKDDKKVGYIVVDFNGEPAYADLKGRWKSAQAYAVIHRLTIDDGYKGRGCAAEALRAVEALCREKGVHSIRVDTDDGNLTMGHILRKNGFDHCGTVQFDDGEKIAFEKIMSPF